MTLPATALAAWIAFVDGPVAAARSGVQLRLDALRTAVTRGLAPGQFRSLGDGDDAVFPQPRCRRNAARCVRAAGSAGRCRAAAGACRWCSPTAPATQCPPTAACYTIDLAERRSYEGVPGDGATGASRSFGQQAFVCRRRRPACRAGRALDVLRNRRAAALGSSRDLRARAALAHRLGGCMCIVLGLLAVPLARLRPRQGRHARVPLGSAAVRGVRGPADHAAGRCWSAAIRRRCSGCGGCTRPFCCWGWRCCDLPRL